MQLTRKLALPAALVALLAAAAPAAAQNDLFNDFQGDGQIDPCAYSPGQLQNGLNNLPPDLQQYAPGFGDQLRAGLEAQCGGGGTTVTTPDGETVIPVIPSAGGGGPTAQFPKPPAPKPAARERLGNVAAPPVSIAPVGSDAPEWITPLVAGILGLLLLALLAALRFSGHTGERLTRRVRAGFSDLGGRTADALATAADLLRFGR
jgi:hypothetical protein